MIKARVSVPSCTDKPFLSWTQEYIIETCRVERGDNNTQPLQSTVQTPLVKTNRAESPEWYEGDASVTTKFVRNVVS